MSLACSINASSTEVFDGLYLRYEGAEYESAFIPCKVSGVWFITGEEALEQLKIKYSNLPHSKYGEIWASLELVVEPIDKDENPNSHYEAVATVVSIINAEYDEGKIASCRHQ